MQKIKSFLLVIIAFTFAFIPMSCSDDENISEKNVPKEVMAIFKAKYPNVNAKWNYDGALIKAEFVKEGYEYDVWFKRQGDWVKTEIDADKKALTTAIKSFLETKYPNYVVDKVKIIEQPVARYFIVELEKQGLPKVTLYLTAEGVIYDNTYDDYTSGNTNIPAEVLAAFGAKYPKISPKWAIENGLYKAQFYLNDNEVEAYFTANGVWKKSETDINNKDLPVAVTEYVVKNYPGYSISAEKYIETPEGNYYEINIVQEGKQDIKLLLTAEGKIYTVK